MRNDKLAMYVVCRNPRDFPDKVVVRRFLIGDVPTPDAKPHFVGESIEAARRSIPPGLIGIRRDPRDEPQIEEVWF